MALPFLLVDWSPMLAQTKNAKVPSQDNSYDCGLFVLTFAAKLLQVIDDTS